MSIKKILTGVFLGSSLLVLAGCGGGNAPSQDNSQNPATNNPKQESSTPAPPVVDEKIPPATGKVDDTVNSIIDGANSEKTQATSDNGDATSAVSDSQDTTNLSNSYDQNAL